MSLLSPWFLLAGLAALVLPLWLHLLERQNPIRVPFSSLMFFSKHTERSIRRRHLKYLALLAARLALLALLAVLFARPVFRHSVAASLERPRSRLIAVDTSFSMSYGDRWKQAQSEALSLVSQVRSSDRVQVVAFGPGVRIMNDPTDDRAVLRSSVTSLKPTMSRNSYGELGQSLRALAQNAAATPGAGLAEVHVISDFQQSAMPGRFADLSLPASASLVTHSVGSAGSRNWCVESVKGDTRLFQDAKPRIEVTVAGFDTPAATRRVWLTVNGRQVATKTVTVPESGRATVEFSGFEVPYGQSRGEAHIDSADSLPGDDVRLISFQRSDPSPILFLHEPSKTRELLYYRTALEASGQSMFTIQPATPVEAGSLPLEKFAFVILCDVPRLPAALEQRIKSFVQAGGAALLVLGPSVALEGSAPLLTGRVADAHYTPREGERFRQVTQADPQHPALHDSKAFAGVKFFRYVRFDTAAPPSGPAVAVLARLADGSPLLAEETLGAGRLLVLSSSLDNIWNDLPVSPLFVPFVLESSRYLSGVEEILMQATIDSMLELEKRRDPRAAVEVIDPAGHRALTLAAAVTSRELPLTSIGFWEVHRAGKLELVAVNPDPRESDLRPIPNDVLAMWKSTGRPEAGAASGAAPRAAAQTGSTDIWRAILIVVLLAAVLESILGNLHLGLRGEVGSP
ncbi:MAG TPA: BatA domain-containing protein [Bryobacterales bacterium]|nr:BatA domain-containing protein [Bryobacterales bacterium]